jgi:hypothetical protein
LERRRQGLCYNCDEPFVHGHQCKRLFYLESSDYIDDKGGPADVGAAAGEEVADPVDALANALVVSLHAVAGIPTENTMVVDTAIQGQCLLALLDTGSTHNFIQGAAMQKLGLATAAGDQLRITVVNGDRLRCVGVARDVLVMIAGEQYHITYVGIDLGCFDFILGVDFLRTLGPITWDFDAKQLFVSGFPEGAGRPQTLAALSLSALAAACTTAPLRRPRRRPPPAAHPYSLREIPGRIRNPITITVCKSVFQTV